MGIQRVALVTGAAGSIGAAIAESLLQEGMKVVLNDVDEDALLHVAGTLEGAVFPRAFDISDSDQVKNEITQIGSEIGEIDILVNNAGILSNHKLETTPVQEWQKVLAVNLSGAFYLSKAVVPSMKRKKWGRIVNVCSLAAKSGGITAGTAYSTSKGALISLTFSIARETAPYGITVNGIAPAYVRTPMVTDHLSVEKQKELLSLIPVGRFCEPEEIAHLVRFLVHPLSGFITGEIIDINGGIQFD